MQMTTKSLAADAKAHVLGFYEDDIEELQHDVVAAGGSQRLVAAGRFLCQSKDVTNWWESVGGDTEMGPRYIWILYHHVIAQAIDCILRDHRRCAHGRV